MNSSFVAISTLVKSSIGEQCLINILMNISIQLLRDYLECANIYKGKGSKEETVLVEMIVYGCITNKLNKLKTEDISSKEANQILNKNGIIVKSLPGYGNAELKKEDVKPTVTEKPFIKVWKILNKNTTPPPKSLLLLMKIITKWLLLMIITINDDYYKCLLTMISKIVPHHINFINGNISINTYYSKCIKLRTLFFDKIKFLFKLFSFSSSNQLFPMS